MLSLRYHRQYLWFFFFLFLALFCTALVVDCVFPPQIARAQPGQAQTTPEFVFRTPRFITVLTVFVCSVLSIVVQNSLSKKIVRADVLAGDRKKWLMRNIKIKARRRKIKKVAKKRKPTAFLFTFLFAHLIHLAPVIILYGLWFGGIEAVTNSMLMKPASLLGKRKIFAPEFFIPAIFIKYIAWYMNTISSIFFLFRQEPRRGLMLNVH